MATIRDIAKLAGVSVPTVSRVLNDQPVDAEMTARVRKAARDLNYVPNRSARRLRGVGTQLVGAIFSDLANPFYMQILRALEGRFAQSGHTLIVGNSDADPEREARLIRVMREEGVAGLVIAPASEATQTLAEPVRGGFPVVVVDRVMRDLAVDTVQIRNADAAANAVAHLARTGHRRIGFIGGPEHLSSARERHAGFRRGLEAAGLSCHPGHVRSGDYRMESGRRGAADLLALDAPPSAILVANNEMLIGALNHIHSTGRRIPGDVAIVGFDDFPWSISLNPPLTAIAQPSEAIGQAAAQLLLDRIADHGLPARVVTLEAELIVRASCGAPPSRTTDNQQEPTREQAQ
ncbi:MAG: LacI family DNA-binding transcriptional regulator [Tropicimonas sp.]|uniref:LacI family DNA-binding transcriptional regulator n=1 Tax=Tropicimonas sp. TaxID=2067044 RepID=UPI003A84FDFC